MPINFNILGQQTQPTGGVVATLPSSGGSGGIGDLLQGLTSFVGAMKGTSSQSGNTLLDNASKYLGVGEHNPVIKDYLSKTNPNLDPSATPWCAGFVGSVLNSSGFKGTGSLAAKSYLQYGQATTTPTRGDIVVFNDLTGRNDPAHGHVGFVDHVDAKTGQVFTLGGNQDDSVSIKPYPMSMVAGFRVPPTGQQVQQISNQNGIQTPKQLINLPKSINQSMNGSNNPSPLSPGQMSAGPAQASQITAINDKHTPSNWDNLGNQTPQNDDQGVNTLTNSTQMGQSNDQVPTGVVTPTLSSQFSNHTLPRGLRNNNPGNLESGSNSLPGQVKGGDPRFAQFATPEAGLGALDNLLQTKYNNQTLTQIVSKYAPAKENDTHQYIKDLSKATGLDPNQAVDMSNPATRKEVMKGIIQIENGKQPYTDDQFNKAMGTPNPSSSQAMNDGPRFIKDGPNSHSGSWSFPGSAPGTPGSMPTIPRATDGTSNMPIINDAPDPNIRGNTTMASGNRTAPGRVYAEDTRQNVLPNVRAFNRNVPVRDLTPQEIDAIMKHLHGANDQNSENPTLQSLFYPDWQV